MSNPHNTFVPENELEIQLQSAQSGSLSVEEFISALVKSQVFVLLDREVPDSEDITNLQPLQLTSPQGYGVFAVFTSPGRSSQIAANFPDFNFGLLVSFSWLLKSATSDIGIVINPGSTVGLEIPSNGITEIKRDFDIV